MTVVGLSGTELAPGEPVEVLVDAALRHGLGSVELWYPRNTGDDPSCALRALDRAGLTVSCLGTATDLGTPATAERDTRVLLRAVEVAAGAGIPIVNTYFGYPPTADDDRSIDAYARQVAPVLAVAERTGVTVTLENEFDCFGLDPAGTDLTRRPAAVRRLLDVVASPRFALTFDACNAYFAGVDPLGYLATLGDAVRHVHVKDGAVTAGEPPGTTRWRTFSDGGRPLATTPLGAGEVPWPAVLEALRGLGYGGAFALEPHSAEDFREAAWEQAVTAFAAMTTA